LDTRFIPHDAASKITGYNHNTAANNRSFDYEKTKDNNSLMDHKQALGGNCQFFKRC
jgi:hypothetical protein